MRFGSNPLRCDPVRFDGATVPPRLFAFPFHTGGRGTPASASPRLPAAVSERRCCSAQAAHSQPRGPRLALWSSPREQQRVPALREGCSGALPGGSLRHTHAPRPDSHRRAPPPPTRPRAPPAVSAPGVPASPQVSPSVPSPRPTPGAPSRPQGAAALHANGQAPAAPAAPRPPLSPGQASPAWSPGCRVLTRELERPGQHCRHGGGPRARARAASCREV